MFLNYVVNVYFLSDNYLSGVHTVLAIMMSCLAYAVLTIESLNETDGFVKHSTLMD